MFKTQVLPLCIAMLLYTACAWAGADSVTIKIGCTIPAIPGVNVPPYPSKNTTMNTPAPNKEKYVLQQEKKQQSAYIMEEKEIRLAKATTQVQTIYNR